MSQDSLSNALAGAAAGVAATLPMTAAIAVCQSRLPLSDQFAAPPPHQVAMDMARAVGLHSRLDLDDRVLLTIASHFGYGAAAGMLYGALAEEEESSPVLRGIGFGCAVWGGSYLGWLPAAGFRAAAHRMSQRRNLMMFAAHVVSRLQQRGNQPAADHARSAGDQDLHGDLPCKSRPPPLLPPAALASGGASHGRESDATVGESRRFLRGRRENKAPRVAPQTTCDAT